MDDENNQNQEDPLNQDPVPTENKAPDNIFSEENSIDSSEKTPRVYKLWHLIAALGLGAVLTASAFLLPSFGGQGFIGGQLPAVDNLSPTADFSLFTGALTPGLSNFTGELTPELNNAPLPVTNVIKLDPAYLIPETTLPMVDFEDVPTRTITNPVTVSQPTTTTTTTTTVSEPVITNPVTVPVSDFEDLPTNTITNPVTVPQYTIVQPAETTITNPVTITQPVFQPVTQPNVEYTNVPIPTNYTLKTIQ